MDDSYKEVYFGQYCQTCEHRNLLEIQEPCDDCLNNPVNVYSHKPVFYKKKEERNDKT